MTASTQIADRAGRARRACVDKLDGIAGLLGQTQTNLLELQTVLAEVVSTAGGRGQSADPLAELNMALSGLSMTLKEISAVLTTDTAKAALRGLSEATRETNRTTLEFQIHTTLTAITVASMVQRNQQLDAYVKSLAVIGENLTSISGRVCKRIYATTFARALTVFGEVASEFSKLSKSLTASDAAAERQNMKNSESSELDDAATRLEVETRRELGRLVGILQFTDTFAQRSDHIIKIVTLANSASNARAKALYRLSLAQSDDLFAEMKRSSAELGESLTRFSDEAQAARTVFDRKVESGGLQAMLIARSRSLERAIRSVQGIAPRFDEIAATTQEIIGSSREVRTALDELENICKEIMLASINAGLIASRMSAAGGPLAVLASTAQEHSVESSRQIRRTMQHFQKLVDTVDDVDVPGLLSAADGFTATASRLNKEACDVVEKTASLNETTARVASILGRMELVAAAVTEGLTAVDMTLRDFQDAMKEVRKREEWIEVPPEDGKTLDLTDIRAMYTMSVERDIHDRHLGLAVETQSSEQSEDLDDILF